MSETLSFDTAFDQPSGACVRVSPLVRRIVAEIGPDTVPPRFDPDAHAATGACGAPPQRAAVAGAGRRG